MFCFLSQPPLYSFVLLSADWVIRSKGFYAMGTPMKLLPPLWSTAWALMKVKRSDISATFTIFPLSFFFFCFDWPLSGSIPPPQALSPLWGRAVFLQQKSYRLLTELKPSWCDLNQRAPSRKGTPLIKHRGRDYLMYICGTGDILVIGVKLCIDVFIFVTSGGEMKGTTHCIFCSFVMLILNEAALEHWRATGWCIWMTGWNDKDTAKKLF